MRLTFLGTGTSAGVPVIGCTCPVCTSPDPRNERTRTSALLHIAGKQILIDAGPDFRTQALANRITHLDAVLLTHAHQDHIGGIDDLRPLIEPNHPMPVYGTLQTLSDLRQRFSYAFTDVSDGSSRPSLELIPIENHKPFAIDGIGIIPFDVTHGSWTITGYRIGYLGYVTDASALPPASGALLRGLEVLVINALRYKPHPTHFNLSQALDAIAGLRPQRAFLVHLTHAFDYIVTSATLPAGVELAFDGLAVELEGT